VALATDQAFALYMGTPQLSHELVFGTGSWIAKRVRFTIQRLRNEASGAVSRFCLLIA